MIHVTLALPIGVDVRFLGGTIIGHNADWPAGTNLRGVYMTGGV